MKKNMSTIMIYSLTLIYLEFISFILIFNKMPQITFIYPIMFSFILAILLDVFSHLFNEKWNKIITLIFIISFTTFYIFNYMYFEMFSVPFSISTIELADQAMDFYDIGFHLVLTKIVEALLMLTPLLILIIYLNKVDFGKKNKKNHFLKLGLVLIIYGITLLLLNLDNNHLYSAHNLYYDIDSINSSNEVLGVFTTQRLNLKRNIFGFNEKLMLEDNKEEINDDIKYNKIDIDFDYLIANESNESIKNTYNFLKNKEATKQNEYTGYYEGKNLIFILAEGFNSIAVDENRTPTLYKMINEGFNFTNYYSPVFLSTTGGEFQAMTSLIPTQEILGSWRKNSPYLPYAIGTSFSSIGYNAYAYHNWTYTYYGRDKTMPTLGFNNYKACGNGIENSMECKWLPSDVDLINTTFDDYKKETPFVTYYVTVSGHAPYVFNDGNSIAKKNKEAVEDLPYSDSVKSYLACQLELENALNNLIDNLKKADILDDTVIVLTGDHYPYTLTADEINEISSYERDDVIEVNHSNLIIWNNKKENKKIDKVASQIDVLPTILNLFGIEYDSRLLIGNDIFSDSEGFAIFSNRSWVSDKGTYKIGDEFTSLNNEQVDDEYIYEMNNRVSNSFAISKIIIENDLYKKILESRY